MTPGVNTTIARSASSPDHSLLGPSTFISHCEGGPYDQAAYCAGDEKYPCDKDGFSDPWQLAPGYLTDNRGLRTTEDQVQPNLTAGLSSTSQATPTTSSTPVSSNTCSTSPLPVIQSSPLPCPSAHKAKVGIGAGLGLPLAALAGGAVYWALRERRLRKRAELLPPGYARDFGGVSDTGK